MSYETRLRGEIYAKIDELIASGDVLRAAWIAQEVCTSHDDAVVRSHEDAEYWLWCGYRTTREMVRRCLSVKIEPEDAPSNQNLSLPGFEHLQTHYLVSRGAEDVGVRLHDMTNAEISAKAAQYRAMGAGCYAHADELDRFQLLTDGEEVA